MRVSGYGLYRQTVTDFGTFGIGGQLPTLDF